MGNLISYVCYLPFVYDGENGRIYVKHNGTVYPNNYPLGDCHIERKTSCSFIDNVIDKFPFRICEVRTDRGHEFQAKFHWHVEDKGIRHAYIKPRSPQLNGKVERSHRSDQEEFYQLLNYVNDVDLNLKLIEWENFYNFSRPHGAFGGQTPYEILRERLQ